LGRKIEREGGISTIREKKLLKKLGFIALIIISLSFGVYIALDHGDKPRDAAVANGQEEPRTETETQFPEVPQADMDRTAAFVDDNALDGRFWIRIQKGSFTLTAWEGKDLISSYSVAVGEKGGNKEKVGDRRTPEGVFRVERTHDSRAWVHDFGDGKGPVEDAYGPWFIRLETGWKGIGIHGTHDPSSLGKMVTEGCIRMSNEALAEIVGRAVPGTVVLIEP